MTRKIRRAKGARMDTPVEQLGEKETLVHYNAVLLEDLKSTLQLVLEAVQANADRITSLEQAVRANTDRITSLEQAVRANTDRITTLENAVRGLKDDLLDMDRRMTDMERRICSRIDLIAERCDGYDRRFATLEA